MNKSLVFDLGNVVVLWDPFPVVAQHIKGHDPHEFYENCVLPTWRQVNLGRLTESECAKAIANTHDVPLASILAMLHGFKTHQVVLPGMGDLLRRLKAAGVPLYALTNNTREIVVYHRQNTDLIGLFDDVMVSADIGLRKPDPAIYQHMLDKHRLKAQDTVFIDDMPENVKAAQDMGIDAFVFTSPGQCRHELTKRGFASAA